MTILANKQFAAMLPAAIRYGLTGGSGNTSSCGLVLCTGTMPSDSAIAAMTPNSYSSAPVSTAKTASYNLAGGHMALMNQSIPPQWYMDIAPTTKTATAILAGTITWAFYYWSTYTFFILDVSLPNQGGCVQVDKTTVGVGDVITLMNISFSMWR